MLEEVLQSGRRQSGIFFVSFLIQRGKSWLITLGVSMGGLALLRK